MPSTKEVVVRLSNGVSISIQPAHTTCVNIKIDSIAVWKRAVLHGCCRCIVLIRLIVNYGLTSRTYRKEEEMYNQQSLTERIITCDESSTLQSVNHTLQLDSCLISLVYVYSSMHTKASNSVLSKRKMFDGEVRVFRVFNDIRSPYLLNMLYNQ